MKVFRFSAVMIIALFAFASCEKESSNTKVSFEITDSPIDDANVQGAFVTVAAVKVDGKEIDGFGGKQTINLLAYQNGQVKTLGTGNLDISAYSNVSLMLDYDQDAAGSAPGCYVLLKDGTKHALKTAGNTSNEIKANANLLVEASQTNRAVFDFDLRKAIKYNANSGTNNKFQFVQQSDLAAAVRLVNTNKAGEIKGKCSDASGQAGSKIVVYAYKKGTYTESEKQPQGDGNLRFKNAVSSAVVAQDGSYTLAFLEEGDYELRFVGYDDKDKDGKLELKGMLSANVLGNLSLGSLSVKSQTSLEVNLAIIGVLPF